WHRLFGAGASRFFKLHKLHAADRAVVGLVRFEVRVHRAVVDVALRLRGVCALSLPHPNPADLIPTQVYPEAGGGQERSRDEQSLATLLTLSRAGCVRFDLFYRRRLAFLFFQRVLVLVGHASLLASSPRQFYSD